MSVRCVDSRYDSYISTFIPKPFKDIKNLKKISRGVSYFDDKTDLEDSRKRRLSNLRNDIRYNNLFSYSAK